MRRMLLILAGLSLVALPAAARPDLAAGRRIAGKCAPCHAIGEKGASVNPKAPPFRELSKKYPVDSLQESLAEGILTGHTGDMPQFKLTPAQIVDFLGYLRSIQVK